MQMNAQGRRSIPLHDGGPDRGEKEDWDREEGQSEGQGEGQREEQMPVNG